MPDTSKLLLGTKSANWTSTRGNSEVGRVSKSPPLLLLLLLHVMLTSVMLLQCSSCWVPAMSSLQPCWLLL
jgi:hypothetical protein